MLAQILPPCEQSLSFPVEGSAEIVSTFYWACARFHYCSRQHFQADFQSRACTRTPHASWIISWYFYRNVSCSKFQGNVCWDGYTLENFLSTTVSSFCSVRGRGFVKNETNFANVTRTTKVTRVPSARALFFNGSVLTFGLPTKDNACAVKTGLTTEN